MVSGLTMWRLVNLFLFLLRVLPSIPFIPTGFRGLIYVVRYDRRLILCHWAEPR